MTAKLYVDERRGAKPSDAAMGDQVLVKQEKQSKLSTTFKPTPRVVTAKTGSSVTIESPEGGTHHRVPGGRNTSHVCKCVTADQPAEPTVAGQILPTPEPPDSHPTTFRPSQKTTQCPKKFEDFVW